MKHLRSPGLRPRSKPPEQEGPTHMSVATLSFTAIVIAPLLLLVVDLFGRRSPDPSAPPPRSARR